MARRRRLFPRIARCLLHCTGKSTPPTAGSYADAEHVEIQVRLEKQIHNRLCDSLRQQSVISYFSSDHQK
ncbi:hypothetical protein AAHA92_02180 [Salvia divinorum]|uniref:Secreted protein n=1 Tax=Salvia divinorum TaxID=28513 RepID=A0ABD1IDT4_SALDI